MFKATKTAVEKQKKEGLRGRRPKRQTLKGLPGLLPVVSGPMLMGTKGKKSHQTSSWQKP